MSTPLVLLAWSHKYQKTELLRVENHFTCRLEELNNDDDMRLLVFTVNVLNFPCSRIMVTALWGNGREHLRLTCDEFGEILEALDFSRRVSNGDVGQKVGRWEKRVPLVYIGCVYTRDEMVSELHVFPPLSDDLHICG